MAASIRAMRVRSSGFKLSAKVFVIQPIFPAEEDDAVAVVSGTVKSRDEEKNDIVRYKIKLGWTGVE
jgi:hypothetical protein